MPDLKTAIRHLLLPASVLVLTACGAVGNGTVPTSITIAPLGSLAATNQVTTYQCVSGALSGLLHFSNGQYADYRGRMTWTSSDPSIVQVGEHTGLLSPEQLGTATITARYYTLSASVAVTVKPLTQGDITLEKVDQDIYTPVDPSTGFTITTNRKQSQRPGTQVLELVANESGAKRNVSGAAQFVLKDSSGTTLNTINGSTPASSNGSPLPIAAETTSSAFELASGPTPGSYTLDASLDACATPLQIHTNVYTANIQSLKLQPELDSTNGGTGPALGFADSSGNPLPLIAKYAAERLKLTATFANGQTQDLSLIGNFTSSVPAVAAFDYAVLGNGAATDANDILTTLNTQAGTGSVGTTTQVTASFQDGTVTNSTNPGPTSNPLTFTVVNGTLQSLAIEPQTGSSITATSTVDAAQFHAIGNFTVGGNTIQQDLTRLTAFSVYSDPTGSTPSTNLATVVSTPSVFSGLAQPANNDAASNAAGGTVYIGAQTDTGPPNPVIVTAPSRATLTVNPQPDAPSP